MPPHEVAAELPSRLGRSCLVAELSLPSGRLRIGTVHLESESKQRSVEFRKQQLEVIMPHLAPHGNEAEAPIQALLCGDMNMCSASEENATIEGSDFIDAWPAVHPTEPGYTEDSALNQMKALMIKKADQKEGSYPPVRFDRVLLHGETSGRQWEVAGIERLGTTPLVDLPADTVQLWPSDHIGLCAEISAVQ